MFKFVLTALMALAFQAKALEVKEFEKILKENKHVLAHVHADWCPTCKVQKKSLSQIKDKKYKVVNVDFDNDKELKKKYKIFQQSMLISFVGGQEKSRKIGITKKEDIMAFTEKSFSEDSLQGTLDAKRNGSQIPNEARMTMEQATQKLRDSGILDGAKKKGEQYVDFTLPNAQGGKTTLSQELKKGAVILTFYRGGWCPYCNLQLKAYQDKLKEFEANGGTLIAVSPESAQSADTTVDKNELAFDVLSDEGNKIARKYGLVFKLPDDLKEVYLKFGLDLEKNQGNDSWELPLPATYVISKDGKIVYSFLNEDYVQRAEPNDIIKALRTLNN